jgi:hypothetical protein
MMRCCFGKRVWTGLGALAAGLLAISPHVGWVALPVLAGLACPLSMLLIMRGIRRDASPPGPAGEHATAGSGAPGAWAAGIARLCREIERLKAPGGVAPPGPREAARSARSPAG